MLNIGTISTEAILLLIFSLSYNVMIQILYYYTRAGKFSLQAQFQSDNGHSAVSRFMSAPILHYFFIFVDALIITGLFWYCLKIDNLCTLNEMVLIVSGFCLIESVFREIKSKNFNLRRLMSDTGFNLLSVVGTYFIYLKFQF